MMPPLSLDTARAMLAHLSPDMPRGEWASVAMALKSEFGEPAFELFDTWSQRSEKYRQAGTRTTWRSVKAGGGVTIGSLVHMAKASGWRPDAAPPAVSPAALQAEREARQRRAADERERIEQTQREQAQRAHELWAAASPEGEAPYLERKGLKSAHGARFAAGGVLCVPMRDGAGELWNVQHILPERLRYRGTGEPTTDKLYAAGRGARKAGLFHMIGDPAGADVVMVGEGFATCASVHEATGRPVCVAFDAPNLQAVARELHRLYPAALLLVLADNDRPTEAATGRNPGREAAEKAAAAVKGRAVWPEPAELPDDGTDWNDASRHAGPELVGQRIEAAIADMQASVRKAGQGAPQRPAPAPALPAPQPDTETPPAGCAGAGTGTDDAAGDEHDPFAVDDRGVWFGGFDPQGRPRAPMLVCSPLRITARTRMRNGAGWGYLVEFADPERQPKEWVIGGAAL